MANRRMFSQRVTGDEKFLEMPQSAQNLYFHLGIYADDDGFVNPQKILRMVGANPDDLKILLTKNFVIPFESGVIVVTHWKENNYIQGDRYTPTIYQEELKSLSCIQNVYTLDTQVRLGKVRKKEIVLTISPLMANTTKLPVTTKHMEITTEDGMTVENVRPRKEGPPKNKVALRLQHRFISNAVKELGVAPVISMAGYKLVLRALGNGFSEKILEDVIDTWFDENKKEEELVQITQCLSDFRLNTYRIKNK